MKNKSAILALLSVFLALPMAAQTTQVQNIYAAGLSYNNVGTPSLAGTALYAHALTDGSGTYAFTVYDALPTSYKPFVVTSNVSVGIAQKVFSVGSVPVFIPTSAGVSFTGTNTGWAWSTGAMIPVKIKGNWSLMPNVRVVKSSVSNGTGYQAILGLMVAFGK